MSLKIDLSYNALLCYDEFDFYSYLTIAKPIFRCDTRLIFVHTKIRILHVKSE